MTMFQNLGRMMGEAQSLKLQCEACGHVVRWSRPRALALIGPDASPSEIRSKLRCTRCGAQRATVWI